MSKWINKDLFADFAKEKKTENETSFGAGFTKKFTVEKGTVESPNVYEIRFLPDLNNGFYKKMYYHMFKVGEKWKFIQCPKTHNFDNPCPICSVVNKLFQGSESDKNEARRLKRKQKFVCNVFVVDDPRDDGKDDDDKNAGKVMLYEFPGKVEQKLKEEIKDTKNGLGASIFDPSENGYNFILKVGVQSGGQGQSFPEYSMSMFARRPSPIAESENKIDELMEQRIAIDEHFSKNDTSMNELIQVMKDEMFWDLISSEYKRYEKELEKELDDEVPFKEDSSKVEENEESKESSSNESEDDEVSDEDLLAELENL